MGQNELQIEQRLTKLETCVELLTEMVKEMRESDKQKECDTHARNRELLIGVVVGVLTPLILGVGTLIINYFR